MNTPIVELKTPAELDAIREAGRIVAATLAAVGEHAKVGTALCELDELAATVLREAGATPVFTNYRPNGAPRPFPGVIGTSVNDTIVQGVPDGARLADGDLLSIDCGARLDGWCGDAALTLPVGTPLPQDRILLETARQALTDGIAAATPDRRVGDVSHAIGILGRSGGYGIPGRLGGHGIGRDTHEAPFVANDGSPGRGAPLRPGMVLALEPVFLAGGRDSYQRDIDGWALRSDDDSRAAHVKHTVAVTDYGPRVLTAP